jgi:hypothetical protein
MSFVHASRQTSQTVDRARHRVVQVSRDFFPHKGFERHLRGYAAMRSFHVDFFSGH